MNEIEYIKKYIILTIHILMPYLSTIMNDLKFNININYLHYKGFK